jgi:hypothetical protein
MHYTAIAGHLAPHKPDYINIDCMEDVGLCWEDRTADNHPGPKSNELTADKIYELLDATRH